MDHVIKSWITPNTVTGENKGDKILTVESAGSVVFKDLIDAMVKANTGLHRQTIEHVVNLHNETVRDFLLAGYAVNTGLFHATVQLTGLVEEGAWNPETNSMYISLVQGKVLRDGLVDTTVKVLGEKGNAAFISGGKDAATRATDGTVTPGRNYAISGRNIKVMGTDPTVGVYIVSSGGTRRKLDAEMIALNNPSDVIVLLPADLEEGNYEIEIVTQYASGGKDLKIPRTVSKSIVVGGGGGGGGVVDPTA